MSCLPYIKGNTIVHRLDERVRVVLAFLFSLLAALSHSLVILAVLVAVSVVAAITARVAWRTVLRRVIPLNIFMLAVLLFIPLTTPGESFISIGGFSWSLEGIYLALRIILRANAILLVYTALVSTMQPVALANALHRMGLPDAMVHMLFLTIRYVGVFNEEYQRQFRAMRIRSFSHSFSMHAFRSYGYLIGNLLLRSIERSERIIAAMKCRGFQGEFHVLEEQKTRTADLVFLTTAIISLAAIAYMEWILWIR